ncbi:proline-rich transmembrane protein 3 [Rhynchocyon petersi]
MTLCVCGLLLLVLLPSLRAAPTLDRAFPTPLEDSKSHLIPGVQPKGTMGTKSQAHSVLWENPRNENLWASGAPQSPFKETPERPVDAPPSPALHGPKGAQEAQRELPAIGDLQTPHGQGSRGWTRPLDPQEPLEQEALSLHPLESPHLTFIPTTPRLQLGIDTDPGSPTEPGGQAGRQPPGDEDLITEANIKVLDTFPLNHQDLPRTLGPLSGTIRGPVVTEQDHDEEDFQEAAGGPLFTQQEPAAPGSVSPVARASSQGAVAQPDLVLARSLPPAEELPIEPPNKVGDNQEISFPEPPLKQADLSDVKGSPGPQLSGTPASEAPDGHPHAEIAAVNGVDPISPQRVRGAVETPGTPKSPIPGPVDSDPAVNRTESPVGSLQPDELEEWPRRPQSHPPAPPVQAPSTSRRGLIRVTTQRALAQPLPPEPSASSLALAPASTPPDNVTAPPLRWGPLRGVLSFSWDLHVYGVGALFLVPALLALATLAAAPAEPRLALVALVLVLVASGLRSVYMLTDPYGSQARLGVRTGRMLYNLPYPLLLTALATLTLLGLGVGLPPMLQRPFLLGVLASVHATGLLAADLLSTLPVLNLLVQGLSCAWGAAVALGTLCLCRRRLLHRPHDRDASPGPRLLAVAGALGLLASGLQLAAALWLYPSPGRVGRFSWAWWGVHFWLRLLELTWALTLALAALAATRPRPPTEHACWAKLLRLACPAPSGKSEVPERPNNCFAGPSGTGAGSLSVNKSLIRNAAEGGAPSRDWGSAASVGRVPQGDLGTSRCSQAPSLSELDFRPPSPINLSRSIDAALFREHLVRDSVFRRCGLRGPLSPPAGARRPRRGSHPNTGPDSGDCRTLRGLCRSLSDVRGPVPQRMPQADRVVGEASGSSLDSFSRGSLKISWNPWRHGLSSVDSLPLDELPSTVQLLPAPSSAHVPVPSRAVEPQGEIQPRCKPGDSRSASSDTIEL